MRPAVFAANCCSGLSIRGDEEAPQAVKEAPETLTASPIPATCIRRAKLPFTWRIVARSGALRQGEPQALQAPRPAGLDSSARAAEHGELRQLGREATGGPDRDPAGAS